jgi:phosphohistidine phosphatase
LADIERPLNARGRQAAQLMALRTAEQLIPLSLDIQRIFVSPAIRARKTFKAFTKSIPDWKRRQVCEADLYSFSYKDLLTFITELPAELESVAIVGHNPALAELFEFLCGNLPNKFPTATVALLEMNAPWASLTPGCANCSWFDYPKREFEGY